MDKLLDWAFTLAFIAAILIIGYFVYDGVSKAMNEGKLDDRSIEIAEEEYDDDVDARYESEDEDYYEDDGEDLYAEEESIPQEYDDEIAQVMEDVISETQTEEALTASEPESIPSTPEPVEEKEEDVVEEKSVQDPSPAKEEIEKKPEPTKLTAYTAKFLVLAGSFSTKANAETHAKSLEKLGYQPEVVNFINSEMHTVVAARYNSRGSADAAKKQLKSKKIDCYVHTKR